MWSLSSQGKAMEAIEPWFGSKVVLRGKTWWISRGKSGTESLLFCYVRVWFLANHEGTRF